MASRVRRGLGELIASIIVMTALVSAAVTLALIMERASTTMRETGSSVVERLSVAASEPYMSVVLGDNKSLYLIVYPSRPLRIAGLVVLHEGRVKVINVSMLVAGPTKILIDPSYDCSNLSVALLTGEGVVIPYTPSRDPRVLAAVDTGRWDLLEYSSINCRFLSEVENATKTRGGNQAGSGEGSSPTTGSGGGGGSYPSESTIYADPASPGYSDGNPYVIEVLKLRVNGTVNGYYAHLTFTIYSGGKLLGSATIEAFNDPNHSRYDRALIGAFKGDHNETINVYAEALCNGGTCIAGLRFDSGSPEVYMGEASLSLQMSYTTLSGKCPYSKDRITAPLLLAQEALFNSSVSGYCKPGEWGSEIYMTGSVSGYYWTTGPLVLIYSNAEGAFTLAGEVWVRDTVLLRGNPSVVPLPCSGGVKYSLVAFKTSAGDPLTADLLLLYNYTAPYPLIKANASGVILTREVTPSGGELPLSGASYELVAQPYQAIPLAVEVNTTYSEREVQLPSYTRIYYSWNLTSRYTPQPYMLPLPYLVNIECGGRHYTVILPPGPTIAVTQGDTTSYGLASIVSGLPFNITAPAKGALLYAIPVKYSQLTGYTAEANLTGSPAEPLDPSSPSIDPGTYVIVAMPKEPSVDPASYSAAYLKVY